MSLPTINEAILDLLQFHSSRLARMAGSVAKHYLTLDPSKDKEDMIQDAMLLALEHKPSLNYGEDPTLALLYWLTTVMRNICITSSKGARMRQGHSIGLWQAQSRWLSQYTLCEAGAMRRQDYRDSLKSLAHSGLSRQELRTWAAVKIFGCTYDETATLFDITNRAVESAVHRAKLRIQAYLRN